MSLSDVTEKNEIFKKSSFSFPIVETVVEETEVVPLIKFAHLQSIFLVVSLFVQAHRGNQTKILTFFLFFFFWQKALTNERLPTEQVQQTSKLGNLGMFFNFPRHEK